MLNDSSVGAVADARWSDAFVRPLFDSYCFDRIPATIEHALTGHAPGQVLPPAVWSGLPQRYERVIFLLIDAFGWRFVERYRRKFPLLREIFANGVVSKLTSMFPSTTAAHVTCVHTGMPVGRSGVYEWYYYEPAVDAVISPLLFSHAGDVRRETLCRAGIRPADIFPAENFYSHLATKGVRSVVFQDKKYATSSYTRHVCRGAERVPYRNVRRGLDALRAAVTEDCERADGRRSYYFFYIDGFDARCHTAGPNAPELDDLARQLFSEIDERLVRPLLGKAPATALLAAADHGQVEVDPSRAIYLDEAWPEITAHLLTTRQGTPIVPAGSARDFFLHLRPDALETVRDQLRRELAGKAEVHRVDDLEAAGFFGPEVSARLRDRIGNLVVLPFPNESVFWSGNGRFRHGFRGHHGGLTPEEMETVFLALPLG